MNKKLIIVTTAGIALAVACTSPGIANAAAATNAFGVTAAATQSALPSPIVSEVTRGAQDVLLHVHSTKSGTLAVRDASGKLYFRTDLAAGASRIVAPEIGAGATTLELTLSQGSVESKPLKIDIASAADSRPAAPKVSVTDRQGTDATLTAQSDRAGTYTVYDAAGKVVSTATANHAGGEARIHFPVTKDAGSFTVSFAVRGLASERTPFEVPAYTGRFVPLAVTSPKTYEIGHAATITGVATPGARVFVSISPIGFSTTVTPGDDGTWSVTTPAVHARSLPHNSVQQVSADGHDAIDFALTGTAAPAPVDPADGHDQTGDPSGGGAVTPPKPGNGDTGTPVTPITDPGGDKLEAPKLDVSQRNADGAMVNMTSPVPGTFVVFDAKHHEVARSSDQMSVTRAGFWLSVGAGESNLSAVVLDYKGQSSAATPISIPAFTGFVDTPVRVTSDPTFSEAVAKEVTGTSAPNAKITVDLPAYGFTTTTVANAEGAWSVLLPRLSASALYGNTVSAVATTRQWAEFDLIRG